MNIASITALFGYTEAPKSTSKVTRIEILQSVTNFPVSSLFPLCFVLFCIFFFLFLLLLLLRDGGGGGGAFSEQLGIQKGVLGTTGHILHSTSSTPFNIQSQKNYCGSDPFKKKAYLTSNCSVPM